MSTRAVAARRFFTAFYQWSNTLQKPLPPRSARIHRQWYPSCQPLRTFSSSRQILRSKHNTFSGQDGRPEINTRGTTKAVLSNAEQSTQHTTIGSGFENHKADASRMKALMRQVPHPVVVITANSWDAEENKTLYHGMTVSSFNTVQMEPKPMITFNVRLPSKTYNAITQETLPNQFNVHILKNNPTGARIADCFTRGNDEHPFELLQEAGVPLELRDTNIPTINDPSVIAVLSCTLAPGKKIELDDHLVLAAEIASIRQNDNATEEMGLMYLNRAYAVTAVDEGSPSSDSARNPPAASSSKASSHLQVGHQIKWNQLRDSSTIPGKEDNVIVLDRIREIADECPSIFAFPPPMAAKIIRVECRIFDGHSINVPLCLGKRGLERGLLQHEDWRPYLELHGSESENFQFYSAVTAYESSIVSKRVTGLFREDPFATKLSRKRILELCGVEPSTYGLPSKDLLRPLRDAGLLQNSPSIQEAVTQRTLTLEVAEKIEDIMRTEARGLQLTPLFRKLLNIRKPLERNIHGFRLDYKWNREIESLRNMVIHDVIFERLAAKNFDFTGLISPEQRPALLERLISAFLPKSTLGKNKSHWEILYNNGIHPCIIGFNFAFVLEKLATFEGDESESLVETFRTNQLEAWDREAREREAIDEALAREFAAQGWVFEEHLTPESSEKLIKRMHAFLAENTSRIAELGVRGILLRLGAHPASTMDYEGKKLYVHLNPSIKALIEGEQKDEILTPSTSESESEADKIRSLQDLAKSRGDSESEAQKREFMKYMTEDSDGRYHGDVVAQGEVPNGQEESNQVADTTTSLEKDGQSSDEQGRTPS